MIIMGIDPGFSKLGVCIVDYSEDDAVIKWVGMIRTEKSKDKRAVTASSDNVVRCREILQQLRTIAAQYEPDVLCAESQSMPRNASTSFKLGLGFGVLYSFAYTQKIPLIEISPQSLKKKLVGTGSASKTDIENAVVKLYPEFRQLVKGYAKGLHNHMADAVGIVHTNLQHDIILAMRRIK